MSWLLLACGGGSGAGGVIALILLVYVAFSVLVPLALGVTVVAGVILIVRAWRGAPRKTAPAPAASPAPPPPPPRPVVSWARGERPNGSALDAETRTALERVWLADARREHGAVALLGRTSWLLTAAGAPAELVERMQRGGLTKLGHAQTCFALAAGYGRRALGVETRRDLLETRFDEKTDPLVALSREVIESGCVFAGFRSAVASLRAAECADPVAREALATIARGDAERAALSWEILKWMLDSEPEVARSAAARVLRRLPSIDRPAWVAPDAEPWIRGQSPEALRKLGVATPALVRERFDQHLSETRRRLVALLGREGAMAEVNSYE
jgi:hypothetical protein